MVQDLNANPKLPFEDSSFDAITNAVRGEGTERGGQMVAEGQKAVQKSRNGIFYEYHP